MPRTLWKGAISFGLVHIPVGLYPATHDESIDFDWLDKRSMDPVGYKRINKRTGREIDRTNIVKGVKVEGDQYVVLSDDEIRAAYPKTTKTIEIESFVDAADISFVYLDRPYYLLPQGNADKVYALLRETLAQAGKVGIARVVIQTKQHLAALMPVGPALMLHTLRWANEVRGIDDLELPGEGKKSLNAGELRMAKLLVDDMAEAWNPDAYSDRFRDAVMALVEKKRKSGKVEMVEPLEEAEDEDSSNVIDLTALLKRSLNRDKRDDGASRKQDKDESSVTPFKLPGKTARSGSGAARKSADKKTTEKKTTARGSRASADEAATSKKPAARKTASKVAAKTASKTAASKAKKTAAKKTASRSSAKTAAKTTTRRAAARRAA